MRLCSVPKGDKAKSVTPQRLNACITAIGVMFAWRQWLAFISFEFTPMSLAIADNCPVQSFKFGYVPKWRKAEFVLHSDALVVAGNVMLAWSRRIHIV